jgi:hypothetical protein
MLRRAPTPWVPGQLEEPSVHPRLKRRLVIGAAVLATAAFAGGAYAATQDSSVNSQQAFLNDVAKRLNISPAQLNSALKGAFLDQLQAAVAAGRLTQAEANAIKQRLEQSGIPPLGFVPLLKGPRFLWKQSLGGPRMFGGGGALGAAAGYLGLNRTQLLDQLGSGKTLAQIAKAHGKSVSGLEQAMIAAIRSKLDRAVSAQMMTKAQEQQILSNLSADVNEEVNGSWPPFRHGFLVRPGELPPAPEGPPDAAPAPPGGFFGPASTAAGAPPGPSD